MMKLFKKKKSDNKLSATILQEQRSFEYSGTSTVNVSTPIKKPVPLLLPPNISEPITARSSTPPSIVMPKPRRLLTPTREILGRFDHDKTLVEDEPEQRPPPDMISPILLPTPHHEEEQFLNKAIAALPKHSSLHNIDSISTAGSDESSRVYESALESLAGDAHDDDEDDKISLDLPPLSFLKKQQIVDHYNHSETSSGTSSPQRKQPKAAVQSPTSSATVTPTYTIAARKPDHSHHKGDVLNQSKDLEPVVRSLNGDTTIGKLNNNRQIQRVRPNHDEHKNEEDYVQNNDQNQNSRHGQEYKHQQHQQQQLQQQQQQQLQQQQQQQLQQQQREQQQREQQQREQQQREQQQQEQQELLLHQQKQQELQKQKQQQEQHQDLNNKNTQIQQAAAAIQKRQEETTESILLRKMQESKYEELQQKVEMMEKQLVLDREQFSKMENELILNRHEMMQTLINTKEQLNNVLKSREESKARELQYQQQLKKQQLQQLQQVTLQHQQDEIQHHGAEEVYENEDSSDSDYYPPPPPLLQHKKSQQSLDDQHENAYRRMAKSKSQEYLKQQHSRSSSTSIQNSQYYPHYADEDRRSLSRHNSSTSNRSNKLDPSPSNTLVTNSFPQHRRMNNRPRARSIEAGRWHEEQQPVIYDEADMQPYQTRPRRSRSVGRRPRSRGSVVFYEDIPDDVYYNNPRYYNQQDAYSEGYYVQPQTPQQYYYNQYHSQQAPPFRQALPRYPSNNSSRRYGSYHHQQL